MINLCIIDDHKLFRAGLREIVNKNGEFKLIQEFEDIEGVEFEVINSGADLVLLDITFDNRLSFEFIQKLKSINNKLKILILSMHLTRYYILRALESGVDGYCSKNINTYDLFNGLNTVYKGNTYYSPDVSNVMANSFTKSGDYESIKLKSLTAREKEVLNYILMGLRRSEIVKRLHISQKTLDNHKSSILKKFGFKNTTSLVRELATYQKV